MVDIPRRAVLGALGGLIGAGCVSRALEFARPEHSVPNIILVLADDLGYADLSCYGQTRFATPNIDRLAAEGVRCTAHYAGSPVCAPSRCALLTGLHTGHAYIRANDELPERGDVWNDPALEGQRPLAAGMPTIATTLQDAGYHTALIGKWGLGGPGSEGEPGRHGFDYALGYLCQRQAHNHYPDHLWRNGRRVPLDNPVMPAHQRFPAGADPNDARAYDRYRGREYAFEVMLEDALSWIRAHRTRPFFLHFAPTIPHVALQVPEDSLRRFLGRYPEQPYLGDRGYLPHIAPRAAYAAMIARLDDGIGRLMQTLADTGLDRRTLVIFTSDNGATFTTGGYDAAFFASNAPWRGAKQDLYEGGIRVPFIARWPGRVPRGLVRAEPCAAWDLAATCAELAGAPLAEDRDGRSLRPLLEGATASAHPPLYWEYEGMQAVREGDWKAIRNARRDTFELYDLASDPGEQQDLAAANGPVVMRMRELMRDLRTESVLFPLLRGAPS
ncbi:MAG: arylsulfatase [Gemmatimonadetes bacterium]|nr:arylsulfatase [Gemmatimonadota bacterium]